MQSEKLLLYDTVQSELEEKIRRLEEDRHSIDITSGRADGKQTLHLLARSTLIIINLNVSIFKSCGMMRSLGGRRGEILSVQIRREDGLQWCLISLC